MLIILFNVWNTRISVDRSGIKFHKSSDREPVGKIRCTLRTTAYHPQTDGITELSTEQKRQYSLNSSTTKSKTIGAQNYKNFLSLTTLRSMQCQNFRHSNLCSDEYPNIISIDLVYDQSDSDELKEKLKWSGLPPTSWIKMKVLFDFAVIKYGSWIKEKK